MKPDISIVDYGMSNLLSITRAVEKAGYNVDIVDNPENLRNSEKIILPGVGSFPDGMRELNDRGLSEVIKEHISKGKSFMGICLGMQLMMTTGNEFLKTDGLNIIEGEVLPLPENMKGFKIPSINWHKIYEPIPGCWQYSPLKNTSNDEYMYFVHSYFAKPVSPKNILCESRFGELEFASGIVKDNCYGVQFHPEKSGEKGLEILKIFLEL